MTASGSPKLTEYQRSTLTLQCEAWGDRMIHMIEERKAAADYDEEASAAHVKWMGDQAAGWLEIARALSVGQGFK